MTIWTMQARRQLRHSLAKVLCEHSRHADTGGGTGALDPVNEKIKTIDLILESTFETARAIVVREMLSGFRQKHERYILLVEVEERDQGGPFVVKVGLAEKLALELNGWNSCRPVGLRHDLVLLPLEPGATLEVEGKTWMSLVYGDAQQFIGVEDTVPLEEAFLATVRHGNPAVQSMGFVLVELLERLGHLFYATSFVDDPGEPGYVFRIPRLLSGVGHWRSGPFFESIRSDTNVLVSHGVSRFIDPIDYFEQWVFPYFTCEAPGPDHATTLRNPIETFAPPVDAGSPAASVESMPPLIEPQPTDLVPYMLRGSAHGDLHGRNILVGLTHGRALWPTVYDYEDMGPCNLCGWDFVKLETELKIRAFRDIFAREELPFIQSVHDFEMTLDEQTERHHLDGSWPLIGEFSRPAERLRVLLLEIRRMASIHLGLNRGRARQWLEEYYFLLAAYCLNTANYGNLERRELISAYVTAGVAAARLSWPRRRGPEERQQLGLS